jgi:aldehyde:ferredoxin oxidoreductase
VCHFAFGPAWQLYGPSQLVALVRAATGWDVTLPELMRVGERRLSLFRAFNAREGLGPADDRLPEKLFVPLRGGASDSVALDRDEMDQALRWYYEDAGWDTATGAPTSERLRLLGLEAIAA